MRRHPSRFFEAVSLLLGALATVVLAVGIIGPTAAFAEDATPTESADPAEGGEGGEGADPLISEETPGTVLCTLEEDLSNISGMAVTDNGILAVEAGDIRSLTIHTINADDCSTTSDTYGIDPIDPQDMAVASDGTIFVADIGTSEASRQWITLEQFTPGENTVTAYRMTYPGDELPHAEAFLLDADDKPIVIAQDGESAGIYVPSDDLVPDTTQNLPELSKVGDFTPQQTGTSNPMRQIGNALVTGAAKSPDGSRVVIRTVSDAYEFEVADGDIATAITEGTPLVTRLPDEGSGSGAIAYSLDGESFLTLGKKESGATENVSLLSYPRHQPPPDDPVDEGPPPESGSKGFLDSLSFSELTRIVSAVGVVGLVLAIAGIVGIRRARRRRREEEEYDDYDDYYDDDPRGRGRGRRGGRGGRGGRDDYGRGGYGDYDDGYGDQQGYGAPGYEGGYADAGYGRGGYGAEGYAPNDYGGNGYAGAPGYGADQYGGEQYAGQQGYDPYGQPQYGADQYGADQYGADQYGGQQHYGADPYGGQAAPEQYGGQPGYGGGQPGYGGGYGYEDDFDPMQDPRRR